MSFSQYNKLEEKFQTGSSDFGHDEELLKRFYEIELYKKEASKRPFYYFYEDVIEEKVLLEFEKILEGPMFKGASLDASACLEIAPRLRKMNPTKIYGWLASALKFTDYLVLHCIQEVFEKKPEKIKNCGVESSRYIQLSTLGNDHLHVAGSTLKNLYENRNEMEHRTKTIGGKQVLCTPQFSKIKREVDKQYKNVLKRLLSFYSSKF